MFPVYILISDSYCFTLPDNALVDEEDESLTVDSWRPKLEYFLWKVYAELR